MLMLFPKVFMSYKALCFLGVFLLCAVAAIGEPREESQREKSRGSKVKGREIDCGEWKC
jgi:hypothetical protein